MQDAVSLTVSRTDDLFAPTVRKRSEPALCCGTDPGILRCSKWVSAPHPRLFGTVAASRDCLCIKGSKEELMASAPYLLVLFVMTIVATLAAAARSYAETPGKS